MLSEPHREPKLQRPIRGLSRSFAAIPEVGREYPSCLCLLSRRNRLVMGHRGIYTSPRPDNCLRREVQKYMHRNPGGVAMAVMDGQQVDLPRKPTMLIPLVCT
jgi:hypothetical protein